MVFLARLLGLAVALYLLGHPWAFGMRLQAVFENFDIAREQYQRQAGTQWHRLDPNATDHLTLGVIRRAFPVIGGGGADIGALEEGILEEATNAARHKISIPDCFTYFIFGFFVSTCL